MFLHLRRPAGESGHIIGSRVDAYRGYNVRKEISVRSGGAELNSGGGESVLRMGRC